MKLEKFKYDNRSVRNFAFATILWGVVGMLVGLTIALQLAFPNWFNEYLGFKILVFGRLRPLHTNAIIFAFVGNGIFTGVYYSLQRLLKTRMWSDKLSAIHFWGWQFIILCAALTLPLGYTQGKEYAELVWWIDILVALIWVVFGWNMFATILVRRVRHIYVAIWFYIATFVTVAILHIFNSLAIPTSLMHSYPVYAGVQDALVQWWYGHNAVAFFLTTPYLGLMYYFVPKASNRPVFSYKLSIVHFWALIFLYIWAGPHHLLYTALPDWAQSLGVVFSVMLIAPSWGGMLNGLLTLRGAWDRVRDDVTLKFMVVAITAYGMSTFEGPMLSLKSVNVITHFTDWVVAHVHIGGLGWNGMLTFGMLYWLIPRLYRTKVYSMKLANVHFWIATLGILLWTIPMYWAGWVQGLMWQQFEPTGELTHKFIDTVTNLHPLYVLRSLGGLIYLTGALIMTYNLIMTIKKGSFVPEEEVEAAPLAKGYTASKGEYWHHKLERRPVQFLIISILVVSIGGIVEIVPLLTVKSNIPTISSVKPLTPLELEGRDIYVREGCYLCHSQMVRPLRFETARYGEYSKPGEFVYDHPFQWGSKRTGPDLAREGTKKLKKSNYWHFNHLELPKVTSQGSVMPAYPWLLEDNLNTSNLKSKISTLRTLGVPYEEGYGDIALEDLNTQAAEIAKSILEENSKINNENYSNDQLDDLKKKEIIAVIAYLQRLGTDIENK